MTAKFGAGAHAEVIQLAVRPEAILPEVPMSHSKMLATRRRKARNKRRLELIAKREKKLWNQSAKTPNPSAAAKEPGQPQALK